ncbi:putative uncharacterized protein DDB_G0267716 [Melitaea cinxia]|uniref:putative uncharacterized protein DDB_G0267716 n=1 Tax=Melitaea cinxia TaxID=113334 RepID=UPI001E270F1B|nr:putative uncharacterized protein DDB_G0267716 [Melitaea cinxia]
MCEVKGKEYESGESLEDEYAPEEDEAAADEVPQMFINRVGAIQNSEDRELTQDSRFVAHKNFNNRKDDLEKFSDIEIRKEKAKYNPNDASYQDERFSNVKETPNYVFHTSNAAEIGDRHLSHNSQKNRIECRNLDQNQLSSDNYGDFLFKKFNNDMKKDNSDYLEDINEKSNLKQKYNNRPLENNMARKDDEFSDRNRREVENFEEKPITDINHNENDNLGAGNENAILKNIKKLSEQDLEDLMNSLSEDKKALLKKIMDKREITKKSGAVEDSSSLEQSDTSKIEGSYAENTNSISSLSSNSDTTETNKNIESGGGLNTKVSDTESDSGKVGSKSGEISDTSTTEDLLEITNANSKDDANIDNNSKENIKSDNKREVNGNYFTNENAPLDNSVVLDIKNSNNLPIREEISENEDWLENNNEELIAEPREVSPDDRSNFAALEKLEDSFPNLNAYRDTDSELEPLIRIKRKELKHKVKKRDLPLSLNDDNTSFHENFESEGSENQGKNKLNSIETLYSQSDCLNKNFASMEHNLRNNEKLRKKRALSYNVALNKTSENDTLKYKRSRSMESLIDEKNSMPANEMGVSEYKEMDAFRSFPQNFGEELIHLKE